MNGFQGMDPLAVRSFAEDCVRGSDRLESLRSHLEGTITAVPWTGSDADAFRERWSSAAAGRLAELSTSLQELSRRAYGQADQQDVASEQDGTGSGPTDGPDTIPSAASDLSTGYRHQDNPWLPNWLEDPAENAVSGLAEGFSDAVGWGVDTAFDGVGAIGDRLGLNTAGLDQAQRDVDGFGETLTDWATGERVPTIAEVVAGGTLAAGSSAVAGYEMVTGEDSALLDDRPGGIVHDVTVDSAPAPSPQNLTDLVRQNNALRGGGGDAVGSGQIGIQEVTSADGGEPSYIVQVPPTEGAPITDTDAWGAQGNSRDWASNLRLVAGQHPAAMDDVRAAMAAAGVPPGANVMLVGHSQGGIVGSHLAADPSFNNDSGAPGTYNVTHSFSVGSPVQTVTPAQGGTEVVNVAHELDHPGGSLLAGDPIAHLDLQGLQVDGGHLGGPNVHEVVLPGYPAPAGMPWLEANHDSVGPQGSPDGGYAGTVDRHTAADPTLSALQDDLTGRYLGPGTVVTRTTVVDVGREDLR